MREMQYSYGEKAQTNKRKTIEKSKPKKCEYLFAIEAEKERKKKQYLRNKVFENIKNILGFEAAVVRFDDIIRDIHNVCFSDLLQEQEKYIVDNNIQKNNSSIYDIVAGKALEQFKNSDALGKDIIFDEKLKEKDESLISQGREAISSHIMYRVLIGDHIDDKFKEQDRTFIYDARDVKIESILQQFANVRNEKELFDLENELKKDIAILNKKDYLNDIEH